MGEKDFDLLQFYSCSHCFSLIYTLWEKKKIKICNSCVFGLPNPISKFLHLIKWEWYNSLNRELNDSWNDFCECIGRFTPMILHELLAGNDILSPERTKLNFLSSKDFHFLKLQRKSGYFNIDSVLFGIHTCKVGWIGDVEPALKILTPCTRTMP